MIHKFINSPMIKRNWQKICFRIFLVFLLLPLFYFLRRTARDRVGNFGCFDDCFNYMSGFFLLSGKRLFSEIFFNHQPLSAYISALVQYFNPAGSLYEFIYNHRMFIFHYSSVWDVVLVLRFGLVGFGFVILYETTKGYIFGDRFLAEGMIIYPLVYLLSLAWESYHKKNINKFDLLLSSIFTWFVVFQREPYVPLVLFLFLYVIYKNKQTIFSKISLLIFVLLSSITILIHPLSDYWYQVVVVSNQSVLGAESKVGVLFNAIFYPLLIFIKGNWNDFRIIEIVLNSLLILLIGYQIIKRKNWKLSLFIFFVLILSNLRATEPGILYYAAFHMIEWYGLLITIILLLLIDLWKRNKKLGVIFSFILLSLIFFAVFSPKSYLFEKIDRIAEFNTNYGHIYAVGKTIQALSNSQDSLFLDGWDDLIYWQAQRYSQYQYSWYTSSMPNFFIFRQARIDMFARNPPDFYYGQCDDKIKKISLPDELHDEYVRLLVDNNLTCIFIYKDKLKSITEAQWKLDKFSYQPI